MLLIPCPHCGPRAEIEFRHAGEAHLVRRTDGVDDVPGREPVPFCDTCLTFRADANPLALFQ